MPADQKVCVVTIHGVGFQQPPRDGTPGYADGLHASLARVLGGRLGSDPHRGQGPVYVMSARPGTRETEWGLSRLGTWQAGGSGGAGGAGGGRAGIDIAGAPLTAGSEPAAHVAVVYNPLEGVGPRVVPGGATLAEAGLRLGHYASVAGAIRLAVGDAWAALHESATVPQQPVPQQPGRQQSGTQQSGTQQSGPADSGPPQSSLRPRDDVRHGRDTHPRSQARPAGSFGAGLASVVRTLEDDVVAYVARNDLREPVRAFIAEVLRRLLARPDVASVVVNAHSQGTVVAFDVLRDYPVGPVPGVRALVTCGSPLRKYADLFSWGNDAGGIQGMTWLNFWDDKDPIADPLDPPPQWHFGDQPERKKGTLGLMWATDTAGAQVPVPVRDDRVDNVRNASGAGLRAHNYWGNAAEVIAPLGEVVTSALADAGLARTAGR